MATSGALGVKTGALMDFNEPIKETGGLRQPLLTSSDIEIVVDVGDESDDYDDNNIVATVLSTAFSSAGHLANLLPTGTFLLFQILVPIVSNSGNCESDVDTYLTLALLIFCGVLVWITTLTDSFKTTLGRVHYGIVTWFGLWTPQLDRNYALGDPFKWQWVDLFHVITSVTVFYTSTIFSSDVRYCFYPDLTDRTSNLVCNLVPPLAGFVISILFVVFPTKRHGVGYPVTAALLASVKEALDADDDVEVTEEAAPVPTTVPASASPSADADAAPSSNVAAAAASSSTGDVASATPITQVTQAP